MQRSVDEISVHCVGGVWLIPPKKVDACNKMDSQMSSYIRQLRIDVVSTRR